MPRSRRQPFPLPKETRWTASQLVAFNLARARRKAEMTQQEAADAISRYTEAEWTQATVATAEGSVSGTRIRQFNPSELLAFCFAFDVPIGWFFMPPPTDSGLAEALDMPNHASGIGWDWVFGRTAPTERNINPYLEHQDGWPADQRSGPKDRRAPIDAHLDRMISLGPPISEDELPYFYLLGMLRRGLGGSRDLRLSREAEAEWFANAASVLQRVGDVFHAIGHSRPSPTHVLQQRDLDDAREIARLAKRRRVADDRSRCRICGKPVELADPSDAASWAHAGGRIDLADHVVVVDP